MKTENVVLLLFLLQIVFREVAPSESPVLMKILQSVDGANSDKHLFEVTLRLLKSLCICMRETLKEKEDKLLNDGFNFVSETENDEKMVDLYRKIYNKTCLNFQQEISEKLNKPKATENESVQNSGYKNITKNTLVQNMTSDNVQNKKSKIGSILSKILIQNKDTYKYTIRRSNLFRKIFDSQMNSMRRKQIIIISLNFSKNETERGKIPIDIEIFSAQYLNDFKTMPIKNVLPCSVNSVYKYLLNKTINDKIKLFKILKREENIKLYIEIINEESYSNNIINECCDGINKTKPECQYNTNQYGNLTENGKAHIKETIFKILNLLKLYEETTKYDKNNNRNGNRNTNSTDSGISSDDNVFNNTSSRKIFKASLNEFATESSNKKIEKLISKFKKPYKDITKIKHNGLDNYIQKISRDNKENNVMKSLLNTKKFKVMPFMQNGIKTTEFGNKVIKNDILDKEKIHSIQKMFRVDLKKSETLNNKNNFPKYFVKYESEKLNYNENYSSDTTTETAATIILNNVLSNQTKELLKNIKSGTMSKMDLIIKNSFLQTQSSSATNNDLTLKHENSNSKYVTQNVAVSNIGHKESQTISARKIYRSFTDPAQYRTDLVKAIDTTTSRPFTNFKNISPRSTDLNKNTKTLFSQNSTEIIPKFFKNSKNRIIGAQSVLHEQLRNNSYNANDDLLDVIVRQRGRLVRTLAESIEMKDNNVYQSFTVTESLGTNATKTFGSQNKKENVFRDHNMVKNNENAIAQKGDKNDIIQEQIYDINNLQEKTKIFKILERENKVDKIIFLNVTQDSVQHFPTKYNFDMDLLNYNESVGIETESNFTVSMPKIYINSKSFGIPKLTLKTDISTPSYEIKKDITQSSQNTIKIPFLPTISKKPNKTANFKLQSNESSSMESLIIKTRLLTTPKYKTKQMVKHIRASTYESIKGDLLLPTTKTQFRQKLITDKFPKKHKKARNLKGNKKLRSFHKPLIAKNITNATFIDKIGNEIPVEKTTPTTHNINTKVSSTIESKNIAVKTIDFVTVNSITNSTVQNSIKNRMTETLIIIDNYVTGSTKMNISTDESIPERIQSSTAKYEFQQKPVNDKSSKLLVKSRSLNNPIRMPTENEIKVTTKYNTENLLQSTTPSLSKAEKLISIPVESTTDSTDSITTKVSSTLKSKNLATETTDIVTVNHTTYSTVQSSIKNRIDKTPININDFVSDSTKMIKPIDIFMDRSIPARTQSSTEKYEFRHKPVNDKTSKLIKPIISTEDSIKVTTKDDTENQLQSTTHSISEAEKLNSIPVESTTDTTDSITIKVSNTIENKNVATEITDIVTIDPIAYSTVQSSIKNRIDKTPININDFVSDSTKMIKPVDIFTDRSKPERIQSSTAKYEFKQKPVNDKSSKLLVKSRILNKPITMPTQNDIKVTTKYNTENRLQSTTYSILEVIKLNRLPVESTTDTTDSITTKVSNTLESKHLATETTDIVTVNPITYSIVQSSIKNEMNQTPIDIIKTVDLFSDRSIPERTESSTVKYELRHKPVNDKTSKLIKPIILTEDSIKVTTKDDTENQLQSTTRSISEAEKLNSIPEDSTTDTTDSITTKVSSTLKSKNLAIETTDIVTVNPNTFSTVQNSIQLRMDQTPIDVVDFVSDSTKMIKPVDIFTDRSIPKRIQSSIEKYEFKHKPVNDKTSKIKKPIILTEDSIKVTTKDDTENQLQSTTHSISEAVKLNSIPVESTTDTTDSITTKVSSTLKSKNTAIETIDFVTVNSITNSTGQSLVKNRMDETPITINDFVSGSTKKNRFMDISTDRSILEIIQPSTAKYEFGHKPVNNKISKLLVKSRNLIKPTISTEVSIKVTTKDNPENHLQSTLSSLPEPSNSFSVESGTKITDRTTTPSNILDGVTENTVVKATMKSLTSRSIAESTSRAGSTKLTSKESIHVVPPEYSNEAITHKSEYKKEHSDILTVDELVPTGLEDVEKIQSQNTTTEILNVTTTAKDITKSQISNVASNGKTTTMAPFSISNPKVTVIDGKPTVSFKSRNSSSMFTRLTTENTSLKSINQSVSEVIKPSSVLEYSKDDSTHKNQDSTPTTEILEYVENNTRSDKIITNGIVSKTESTKQITSSSKKVNISKNIVNELSEISNTPIKFISIENATTTSLANNSLEKLNESFSKVTKKPKDYAAQQYQASTTKSTSIDEATTLLTSDNNAHSDEAIIKNDKGNSGTTTLSTNSISTIDSGKNIKTNLTAKKVMETDSYLAKINLTSGGTINLLNQTLESTYILSKLSTKMYDIRTSSINYKVFYDFEKMTPKYSELNQVADIKHTLDKDIENINNTVNLASVTFRNKYVKTNTTFNKGITFGNNSKNNDIEIINKKYKHVTYFTTKTNNDYNKNSKPLSFLSTTNMYESNVNVMFNTDKIGHEKEAKIKTSKNKTFENMTTKIHDFSTSATKQVLYNPPSINTSWDYSDKSTHKTLKFTELNPTVMNLLESENVETTELVPYSKDTLSDLNNQSSINNPTEVDIEKHNVTTLSYDEAREFSIETIKKQPSKAKTFQSETAQGFLKIVSEKLTNALSNKTVLKESYKKINSSRYNVSEKNINLKGYSPRSELKSTDQINISNNKTSIVMGVKKTQLFSEFTTKPWKNPMKTDYNLGNLKKNRTIFLKHIKMKVNTPTTIVHKIIYNTFKPASEEDYKTTMLDKETTTSKIKPIYVYINRVVDFVKISTTTLRTTTTKTTTTTTIKTPSTKILIKPTRTVLNPVTARYVQKYNPDMKTNNYNIRSRIVTKNFRVLKQTDVNLASPFEKPTVFPYHRKVLKSMKYRKDENKGRNAFGVPFRKPRPKALLLKPKFDNIKPIKSKDEYFKSPVVPNDEDYYRRDFSMHHRPSGMTFKDKISYLHEALNNQFVDEDKIVEPRPVIEKPSYLLPKNEPKMLRDRIDSVRSYMSEFGTQNVKATSTVSWKSFFIEDDELNESYTRSIVYFNRGNFQQISSTSTTTPKARRKGITLFFYSPTVPYNRYF